MQKTNLIFLTSMLLSLLLFSCSDVSDPVTQGPIKAETDGANTIHSLYIDIIENGSSLVDDGCGIEGYGYYPWTGFWTSDVGSATYKVYCEWEWDEAICSSTDVAVFQIKDDNTVLFEHTFFGNGQSSGFQSDTVDAPNIDPSSEYSYRMGTDIIVEENINKELE